MATKIKESVIRDLIREILGSTGGMPLGMAGPYPEYGSGEESTEKLPIEPNAEIGSDEKNKEIPIEPKKD